MDRPSQSKQKQTKRNDTVIQQQLTRIKNKLSSDLLKQVLQGLIQLKISIDNYEKQQQNKDILLYLVVLHARKILLQVSQIINDFQNSQIQIQKQLFQHAKAIQHRITNLKGQQLFNIVKRQKITKYKLDYNYIPLHQYLNRLIQQKHFQNIVIQKVTKIYFGHKKQQNAIQFTQKLLKEFKQYYSITLIKKQVKNKSKQLYIQMIQNRDLSKVQSVRQWIQSYGKQKNIELSLKNGYNIIQKNKNQSILKNIKLNIPSIYYQYYTIQNQQQQKYLKIQQQKMFLKCSLQQIFLQIKQKQTFLKIQQKNQSKKPNKLIFRKCLFQLNKLKRGQKNQNVRKNLNNLIQSTILGIQQQSFYQQIILNYIKIMAQKIQNEKQQYICCRLHFQHKQTSQSKGFNEQRDMQFKDYYWPLQNQSITKHLKKTIVAFLNSVGGIIFVGLKQDKNKIVQFKGIKLNKNQKLQFIKFIKNNIVAAIYPNIQQQNINYLNKNQKNQYIINKFITIDFMDIFQQGKLSNTKENGIPKYVVRIKIKMGLTHQLYHIIQKNIPQAYVRDDKTVKKKSLQDFFQQFYKRKSSKLNQRQNAGKRDHVYCRFIPFSNDEHAQKTYNQEQIDQYFMKINNNINNG